MEKFVLEIPNFISSDICESIIRRFENDDRKVEGAYNFATGDQLVIRNKNNIELSLTNLTGWEDINQIFLDYTLKAYNDYSKHLKNTFSGYGDPRYPVYGLELDQKQIVCTGFPIQRLGKGDVYEWHHDGDVSEPYFIQVIFYLNTLQENQGGCTEFIDGTKVRPEMGKLLIFPCSWNFPHEGCTVKDGYKYIMSTTVSLIPKRS